MDHESNVGLIYTHAECNRGNDDINLLIQEGILILRSRRPIHSGMIWKCLDIIDDQKLSKFLHFLSAQAIDNAGLSFHSLHELYYILIYLSRFRADLII